ncbi:MAG TPA: HNH endonuclease [Rhizomicrobium sp.]|jgi:hypothetical protein|nr:HNH endonuclease [Rhizomicrobium sp.]
MRVYAFRAGLVEGLRANDDYTLDQAKEWANWMLGSSASTTLVVETRLAIRPFNPHAREPRPTHAFAAREKREPETVFFGMMRHVEYQSMLLEAGKAWLERQATIRRGVEEIRPSSIIPVRWEDLSAALRARLKGSDLSMEQCWLWRPHPRLRRREHDAETEEAAPYREFYAHVKGAVPPGVVLRHKCDNRLCMNPNHLEPGTAKDNVDDMMRRGRHPAQKKARAQAKRRDAHLRRKERLKSDRR